MTMAGTDIVLYWVDSNDPNWKKEKENYQKALNPEQCSVSDIRYQDWDNLKYIFRGIETFMPWVRKVFFVTCGQRPDFLNVNHPKLELVNHKEFIPPKYLPTFNSAAIEMNFFRINDLSENFIIFNDDMFPIRPVDETYYFKNGVVCDEAVENIITTAAYGPISEMGRYSQVNNMFIINRHFHKREVQEKHPEQWFNKEYGSRLKRTESLVYWNDFPGFYDPHVPSALKKSVMEQIWHEEPVALDRSCRNRFRAYTDVTQYVVRYWQLCSGAFIPRPTIGKAFFVDERNYQNAIQCVENQEMPVLCINENCTGEAFARIKKELNAALQQILPNKSSFEI